MNAKTKSKTKLGWLAQRIVENYQRSTKGHEAFLSEALRFAFLSEAVTSLMIAQYGADKQSTIDELVDARGEAIDFLFPDSE